MVISKVGKRKKKDIPVPVKETPQVQESPKRPKVHAQRKFAQGCGGGGSTSFSANTTIQSLGGTPVKTADTPNQEPQELLPNRRPNTEDFLTFLCFRSSSVLPSHLDFFNTNKKPTDKSDTKQDVGGTSASSVSKAGIISKVAETPTKKSETPKKAAALPEPVPADSEKPSFIPFAVRKHADTVAVGTRRQSVQSAKKKGMDQRTATKGTRAKTNSNTIDSQTSEDIECVQDNNMSLNDSSTTLVTTPLKDAKNKRKLRSNQADAVNTSNKEDEIDADKNATSKLQKEAKETPKKSKKAETDSPSKPDKNEKPETSEIAEKPEKVASVTKTVGRPSTRGVKPPMDIKPKKDEETTVANVATRLTRKKSLHSAIVESEDSPSDKSGKKLTKKKDVIVKSLSEEFSSDDERPLAKAVDGNTSELTSLAQKRNLKRLSLPKKKELDDSNDQKSDISSPDTEPIAKKRFSGRKSDPKVAPSKAGQQKKDGKLSDSKLDTDSQEDTDKEPKVKKKRRNEFTDLSQTDQSENETRTGRPMRKTKEAAAIYMELIGQKLNLSDFDNDNFSLDSFPELPNVKKTEQMENEIKANFEKDKKDTKLVKRGRAKTEEKKETPNTDDKFDTTKKEKAMDKAIEIPVKQNGDAKPKLEKSFSDSDDEPLATKCSRKVKSPKMKKKPVANTVGRKDTKPDEKPLKSETIAKNAKLVTVPFAESPKPVPVTLVIPKVEQPKVMSSPTDVQTKVKQSSPKSFDLNDSKFKVPAESVAQLLSPPIHANTINKPLAKDVAMNKIAKATSKDAAGASTSAEGISAILADLMPSKEESGKIFGIASVTLAQSSGPNDTKCTLGKCGSVHKPSLGPMVPTESYLSEQLTSKERRKAKVNMTHEQIEKWLTECSANVEPLETDFLDEDLDLNKPIKPINYLSTPSPFRERDIADSSSSSNNKLLKTNQPPKEKSSLASKGPSLKAKTVALKEEKEIDITDDFAGGVSSERNIADKSVAPGPSLAANSSASPQVKEQKNVPKGKQDPTKCTPIPKPAKVAVLKTVSEVNMSTKPAEKLSTNEISKNSPKPKMKPVKNAIDLSKTSSIPMDKKPIYNRRTPVYNTKVQETPKEKQAKVLNTFGAFSPENEASIYSFDKEEDTIPASTPFRRHSRRDSIHLDESDKSKTGGKSNDAKSTPSKQQQVSLTLSPGDKSQSITVPVSDQGEISKLKKLSEKMAAQAGNESKDSDSEGHTFYIPLQCAATTGAKSDQLIQGVAVKLGTEGPDGPNQKVIMHAKLVTKSKMGTNTTPLPEGMGNVQEIVKNLIANKDSGLKSVPIGTVQPRFKSTDLPNTSTAQPLSNPSQASDSNASLTRHNSGQSLISQKSKAPPKQRQRVETTIKPSNITTFPRHDDPAQMVEAPVFRPTEKEFQDPIEFIDRISQVAARFGLCKIIPPANFKPECKISDDMRFTAYNQYVHKMLHRWGPSVKELSAIKKYLATQSITLTQPPWIGGMEVDLPRLYHTVQELGGLKEVIEKKKWARVAEEMCIPKAAQDRVTKLDDIYCKYLLPYDTLSPAERQKLFDEVEADWAKAEAKARRNADRSGLSDSNSNQESDEEDESEEEEEDGDGGSMECIVKGKSMALSAFFRIARNTMALWFKNTEPTSAEIETEFWRHVAVRDSHVCVHSGSIDSSGWGYGFPTPGPKAKNSPCGKHPWNLKVLTNNNGSILRSIGPVPGITVPTLHVGMLFSACCWYRDPHGLPWIEYLHTGGSKIWYSVPDEQSSSFRSAFTSLVPTHCQNKTVWLPCDTAMVPPHMLTDRGVSLCRTEQEPGQFVVVFPRAYTSSLCTSYTISESVYFASVSWLDTAKEDFKDIHDSCEPAMFSLEQLLFSVATDVRTSVETLERILPMVEEVYNRELEDRKELKSTGVTQSEKFAVKGKKPQAAEENECDICRANLYISWIKTDEDNIYCLQHAVKYLKNERLQTDQCKLIYSYQEDDIKDIINKVNDKLLQNKKKIILKK